MRILDLFRRKPARKMDALPPAAGERADGNWYNPATQLGGNNSRSQCDSYVGRYPKTKYELDAVFENSRLMARFVSLEPNTCLAKGWTISELSGDDVTAFESEMIRLNAFSKIGEAFTWARLYGGAIVYIQINDGRQASEPVDESSVYSIHSLTVFDINELSVASYNESIGSDNFGMPEVYRVSTAGKTFDVHRSRVLHFDGVKVSRRRRREISGSPGFGGSVVTQVWDAFRQYDVNHAYLSEATTKISQGILKLRGFNDAMKTGKAEGIMGRLLAIMASMSVIGDIVVDSDGEDYQVATRPLTGFKEAGEVAEARMLGEMGVPKSLLMMQAPGGLANGDNAGDWQYWAVYCGSTQTNTLESIAKRLSRLVMLAGNSPVSYVPESFTITWPSILQMSEKEKAEIYALRAPGRASDVMSGIVSAVEARASDDVIESYHLDTQETTEYSVDVPPELRVVGT